MVFFFSSRLTFAKIEAKGSYDMKKKIRLPNGTFEDPQWIQMNWTQTQLERLLACHGFTHAEIAGVSPVNGEHPYDILLRARAMRSIICSTNASLLILKLPLDWK